MNPLPKVVLAKNVMTPYRLSFFRELAAKVDLDVVLDAPTNVHRNWKVDLDDLKFRCQVLGSPTMGFDHKSQGESAGGEARLRRFPLRLFGALGRMKPDCVVSTEFGMRSVIAALWCMLRRRPLIIWWEGTPHTEAGVSGKRLALRKWLVRRTARFWSNGAESRAYLRSLGADDSVIDDGATGVDTDYFMKRAAEELSNRDSIRRELGIAGKSVVFSGALSGRKGIAELIAGFDRLYEEGFDEEVTLVLAGDGPERAALEAWKPRSEKFKVKLLGFIQMDELPRLYVSGDLFVLPTLEDNWALATLEPILCGTPSLISKYNGAASDLAGEGGWVFDPKDAADFSRALRAGLAENSRVSEERSRELAHYYHPQQQAERGAHSIRTALKLSRA